MSPVAVHVSPHPDDEILGCGATLLGLRDAGWTVVNLAGSLGRPAQAERRGRELADALGRLGFVDRRVRPGADLTEAVVAAAGDTHAALVVSPHPADGHPFHEEVGAAVAAAGPQLGAAGVVWWTWGLWRDLPTPTLYVRYGADRMAALRAALRAYPGELGRNRYYDLLPARGRALAVLGSERVFGFGADYAGGDCEYADLLAEWRWDPEERRWTPGRPRVVDWARPVDENLNAR